MSEGFFVSGGGIGLEALRKRINEHLGPDVAIEPSTYNVGCQPLTLRLHSYICSRALVATFSVQPDRK